jgi:DNA helicase HerA-like ATPase
MSIFNFSDNEALGSVVSVDTATVIVKVDNLEQLRRMQVNRLIALQSSKAGQHLIGIIQKITRSIDDASIKIEASAVDDLDVSTPERNLVRIALIGTVIDKVGKEENVFRRTLETVPEIDANCFSLEGQRLSAFMRVIANVADNGRNLSIGCYTLDETAEAFLNGNRFFQRHAVIVGSTGSGKSWTTARLLEQVADLANANAIVFDTHGEYGPLTGEGICHFKIAGPDDLDKGRGLADGVIFLPYWLLGYEALTSMFIDRSDMNAPNQAMIISRSIVEAKKKYLQELKQTDLLANFTIDSPIPFKLDDIMRDLEQLNTEMVPGARTEKQGDFHGKLSRLIARLENKRTDRRLGFLFRGGEDTYDFQWLETLCKALVCGRFDRKGKAGGVKILDFSEVPSDVLPLIVSLVARIAFVIQQWTEKGIRHPIALFCDEAHLYIPERVEGGGDVVSVGTFERIAKEGRKYGVGLVVISQRPSEVNRTVLSQCNNLIAMRLTNAEDQAVVRRLLPDSLGGFSDLLPVLDVGEALIVGDASLLPTRVRVAQPKVKPNSGTIAFWDIWALDATGGAVSAAVNNWRRQSLMN